MRGFQVLKSWQGWMGACLFLFLSPNFAHATATITLGTYTLQANTPNQPIFIYVGGGDSGINGVDLTVTTGDGGPGLPFNGTILAPQFMPIKESGGVPPPQLVGSGVYLFASPSNAAPNNAPSTALFTNNNNGQTGAISNNGQFYQAVTATNSGTVTLSGTQTDPITGISGQVLLAEVLINTTGFSSGRYNISVGGTVGAVNNTGQDQPLTQRTTFSESVGNVPDPNFSFTDGTIVVVPEPASLGLFGLAVAALLLRRRRA